MNTSSKNGVSESVPFDEELCERYLFGEMTEAEQERFETTYFTDDTFFNNFLAVKDEILDLYSRNELDHERLRRMEPHFLSTGPRKKRLSESKEFIDSITLIADRADGKASLRSVAGTEPVGLLDAFRSFFSPPRMAASGGLLLVLGVSLWLLIDRSASNNVADSIGEPQARQETASNPEIHESNGDSPERTASRQEPLPQTKSSDEREIAADTDRADPANAAPARPGSSPTPPATQTARSDPPEMKPSDNVNKGVQVPAPDVQKQPDQRPEVAGARTETVTLDSATRSATKRNTAEIGTATQNVVIRLVFGGEAYPSYSVRISGVGGGTVWRASNLKTGMNEGAKSLSVPVPAGSLTRRDYIVVLEGRASDGTTETIREYYLRVDRQ